MDLQTGLVYVGVVVISAAVILLVSMFGIKEKSYEEAIAEQRKLPDDLLLGKKEKGKEKKHKNKTGKKVKEKKEEKEEKDEKPEHVQFEETPQILSPDTPIQEVCKGNKKKNKAEKVKPILVNKDESLLVVPDSGTSPTSFEEVNHFEVTHPKDDLELIRSHSKENLPQLTQSETSVNKSPKETPTKSKRNAPKEIVKKKEESKEEKKETQSVSVAAAPQPPKDNSVKESQKEIQKDLIVQQAPASVKESKKHKKKNDILAQIGGDKDGVNVSLLMPLVQKAELSRSEIQILIDQLLNKQLDNPLEHSEWTEGRADPVIKLKKQLAEKDKALSEEHEASVNYQNKLKELRAELNSERSRLSSSVKQLEEALNNKITEAQTLHTRMQHILESHAAEKQGFARQIEQLQAKVNEDATIIHKMQEDQGQTQGHLQQELITQRKQLEVQFAQMRENENALKTQLAQKHAEVQELQNVNLNMTQDLHATCESSTAEIDILRQQLGLMQEQLMHSEGQLQHLKEAGGRLADMAQQLEESHRSHADLEHRLKNANRHEQELQKQVHSLQAELKMVKAEANDASALQSEVMKLKSETAEITNLRAILNNKDEETKKSQSEAKTAQIEVKKLESILNETRGELSRVKSDSTKAQEELKHEKTELGKVQDELKSVKAKLSQVQDELSNASEYVKTASEVSEELKMVKAELEKQQNGEKISSDVHLKMVKLQEDNDRLLGRVGKFIELQNVLEKLREENKSLTSQIASIKVKSAAEGRENGIEGKAEKNSVQQLEQGNSLAQKDKQLDALKTELSKKQAEFNQLHAQVEVLRNDAMNQNSLAKRLQDDVEAQRSKNNELRTKNWKVMEALSAAESRAKSDSGKSINDDADKIRIAEQESTKSLLQRIFPDVEIKEKSYENWLKSFEEHVRDILSETSQNTDVAKQNKKLQSLVTHYKEIIADTEGMLNNLQSHVELTESRWQSELRQKESDIVNLRLELKELQNKITINEELQERISKLESRLAEEKAFSQSTDVGVAQSKAVGKTEQSLAMVEQLQEEKQRLSQELQIERENRATLDSELNKLRTVVAENKGSLNQEKDLVSKLQIEVARLKNETCGAASNSEQSSVNGPPKSDTSQSEQTRSSMIATIEKAQLKNADTENCKITESNAAVSQQEIDNSLLNSDLNSNNCNTTAHDTQANWNGQQQKKHKKKRKGGSGKK